MRTSKLRDLLVAFGLLLPLAACRPEAWKQDADVRAAKADCAGLAEPQRYTCLERHAVASLNPDVCRLVGIWVDDMCLQAVYEAANDPAICEQLYLEGVRPTCRTYYAALSTPAPSPTLFRSDQFHMEVTLPPDWAAAEGPEWLARPFTGLVSFNSWGQTGFWAPEVKTANGAAYSPGSTLGQVPEGGAYVVLAHFSGGPVMVPEEYGPEYEREDLGGLWLSGDCRDAGGMWSADFHKWGRHLRLEVYCQPDASEATATAVNDLLGSWRFDRAPAGDPGWAALVAKAALPPAAHPEKFPVPAGWPGADEPLQTSLGDGDATRITRAEVQGETVVVTFMLRWGDASLGWSGDECPADRCHWWRCEVRPDGELVMLEEGGAALLDLSMAGGWLQHRDPILGFAAEVPADWQITEPVAELDALGRQWMTMEFVSPDYALGYPPLDQYYFRVAAAESTADTLTETVGLSLSSLAPGFRDQVQVHCCLRVDGEPAMELLNFPPTQWGSRQIFVLHEGWEYHLSFSPLMGISASSEAGAAARKAVERFLDTFVFAPVTITPAPPAPTITPVPTPTLPAADMTHFPA